jgi:hypothetical protein
LSEAIPATEAGVSDEIKSATLGTVGQEGRTRIDREAYLVLLKEE